MAISSEIDKWLKTASINLVVQWGIDQTFSASAALLYLACWLYGLSPIIVSGWRSPEYQRDLLSRYNQGDPTVIYKPAENSLHTYTKLGKPASRAIDIQTNNPTMAAQIAREIGIKTGMDFKSPDKYHYYV